MSEREGQIKARCDAATPGPWGHDHNGTIAIIDEEEWGPSVAQVFPEDNRFARDAQWRKYANFIAHAREDVPYLLEQLTEARALSDKLAEDAAEAKAQIEYLHAKFKATGSGNAVLARLEHSLEAHKRAKESE